MSDYVTFTLDGCDYATRIDRVREVVRLAALTRLPGMSAPLAGILDLRGHSLPVLDIRSGSSDTGDVLVLHTGGADVGFVCDRVTAVLEASLLASEDSGGGDAATPRPRAGILPDYIEQVLRGPSGAVFLVDVEAMAGDLAMRAAQGITELTPA